MISALKTGCSVMDYLFYPNLGQIEGLFSMCIMKVM